MIFINLDIFLNYNNIYKMIISIHYPILAMTIFYNSAAKFKSIKLRACFIYYC